MWQYVKHDKGVYFDLVSFFAAYSYLYRKVNATILCLTVFLKLPVIYDMNFVFWVGRVRKLWLRKITEPDPRGVHQCEDAVSWPHFLYSLCTSCLPMCSSLMPPPPFTPPYPLLPHAASPTWTEPASPLPSLRQAADEEADSAVWDNGVCCGEIKSCSYRQGNTMYVYSSVLNGTCRPYLVASNRRRSLT